MHTLKTKNEVKNLHLTLDGRIENEPPRRKRRGIPF